jgi:hypothetical protein
MRLTVGTRKSARHETERADCPISRPISSNIPGERASPGARSGRFGAEALPHLARIWDLPPRSARRARHRAALEALATMGDRGETADPAWDEAITFDQEGDEPIRYWDGAYASLRARALRSLPEPRRRAQLLRCAAARPWPERAKEAAAAVLDAEGAAAVEAAAKR